MLKYRPLEDYGSQKKLIGEGSYGEVYLYQKDEKKYAIKWQEYSEQLIAEISILLALNHPNIVKIVDVVYKGKMIGIVMHYAKYKTVSNSKIHCKDVKSLIYQLLCGISYMHSRDIQHRDLKPDNLLVFKGCKLKITDFGLADALRCSRSEEKTYIGAVGTLWYRPPEIIFGSKQHTLASDMWAVGCIIYNILTGEPFVDGDDEEEVERMLAKKLGSPSVASWPELDTLPDYLPGFKHLPDPKLFEDLDAEWRDILKSLLIYNPERRKTAYEILLNPIFDSIRDSKLEYPLRGCVENLDSRRPHFPKEHKNRYVTEKMVLLVKGWLFEVLKNFNIGLERFSYACQLLDIYQTKVQLYTESLQESAIACMVIATELKSLYPLLMDDASYISKGKKKEIKKRRMHILNAVHYDLILSTPYDYISLYGRLYPPKILKLALDISIFLFALKYKDRRDPKIQGFACLVLACMYYEYKVLHANLLTIEQLDMIKSISHGSLNNIAKNAVEDFKNRTGMTLKDFLKSVLKKKLLV